MEGVDEAQARTDLLSSFRFHPSSFSIQLAFAF